MSLFQNSVLNKYLKGLDSQQVEQVWNTYTSHFHNPAIQENIRNSKEEQYQEGFLRDLLVNIFGYILNPETNFNLTTELKNLKGAKKTDGAILQDDKALAVIELKGTNTVDLAKVETQAFGYKNNQPDCVYVITSNFEKLRFYIDNAVDFEEFNLFQLSKERFDILYLCLASENLLKGIPKQIKDESLTQEENVTKKLYKDYSQFRNEIFDDIQKNNPQHDKLSLFKKTQKLLDRFLFIFFAEDRLLLPPNSIREIVNQWTDLRDKYDEYQPLYSRFKKYFGYMNTGYKGKQHDIFAYNGGLFAPDKILDNIKIDDELLCTHTLNLSNYDFESEVSVNILGHIFEHSLTEIENIQAQLEGTEIDKSKTKRKKDGVFYTPKYITKYIVDNTIGKLCEEKKTKLGIQEADYEKERKRRKKATIQKLNDQLDTYRQWLIQLTICDPACGSGAFLNQALEYLIAEHQYIDELKAKLLGDAMIFSEVQNAILENNLFGVDINEESVEIAKLSLWLRTAQKGRKLTTLNDNIKCGNSLIDDPEVAGDKAFNWHKEFPDVFQEKEKQAFHVVLTTHNSRTSQRMMKLGIVKGDPIELNLNQEILLTEIIRDIIKEKGYNCIAYNVCRDHVHIILVCEYVELSDIVRTIKSISARKMNVSWGITTTGQAPLEHDENTPPMGLAPLPKRGKTQNHFWSQKFFRVDLDVWQLSTLSKKPGYLYKDTHLSNALVYIRNNRNKHQLPASKKLQAIIDSFVIDQDQAFLPEYTGGFDVVIGNPPYVRQELVKHYAEKLKGFRAYSGKADLYVYFYEKGISILKDNGLLAFISSGKFFEANYGLPLVEYLLNTIQVKEIIDFYDLDVFQGISAYPLILIGKKTKSEMNTFKYCYVPDYNFTSIESFITDIAFTPISISDFKENEYKFVTKEIADIFRKCRVNSKNLKSLNAMPLVGVKTGFNDGFIVNGPTSNPNFIRPYVFGKNIKKYSVVRSQSNIVFPYKRVDSQYKLLNSNELRNTSEILEKNKEKLSKRAIIKEGIIKGNRAWYEYQQINKKLDFDSEYIVYPNVSLGSQFALSKGNVIDMTGFIIPSNDKFLLAILNSSISRLFMNQIAIKRRGGYQEYKVQYLEQIPIKDVGDKLKGSIISLVDIIMDCTEERDRKIEIFLNRVQDNLGIEKVSKKMASFYDHDFKTFLAELKKKKIKLSLTDQDEWDEYFTAYKTEINQLQSQIQKTDKEIDQMVYTLYGLTEDEIKIVENQ